MDRSYSAALCGAAVSKSTSAALGAGGTFTCLGGGSYVLVVLMTSVVVWSGVLGLLSLSPAAVDLAGALSSCGPWAGTVTFPPAVIDRSNRASCRSVLVVTATDAPTAAP